MTLLNMAATYQSLLLFLLWWWLHSSGCYCNCGFRLLLMMCLCFKPLETKWIQLLIHGHLNNIPLTPQSIIKTKQNEVLKKRANNLCHLKFTWQGLFLNWYTHTHTHWACILSGDFLILDFSQQEEAIPEANDEAIDGLSHKVAALNAWFNTSDLF